MKESSNDSYRAEMLYFTKMSKSAAGNKPDAKLAANQLIADVQDGFITWLYQNPALTQQREGGELQLVTPADKILSIDSFSDTTGHYNANKDADMFRFFNASDGFVMATIGRSSFDVRGRGNLHVYADNGTATNFVMNKKYTGATKTAFGNKLVQNSHYEHLRLSCHGNDGDANPATFFDSTSLWFRNNPLYGQWNKSADVKRGMKAAIDPYGNIISVRGIIANHKFSDKRLKKNIEPIDGKTAMEKVAKLNAVSYRWKDEESDKIEGLNIGLLAQDVQKVVPEVVSTKPRIENNDGDGKNAELKDRLYIEYSQLVPLLIESVKEMSKTIADQQKQIDDLKK